MLGYSGCASSRRIIASIFRRPLTQVAIGVVAGTVLVGVGAIGIQNTTQFQGIRPPGLTVGEVLLLVVHATLMLGVCTLACVVPTARALRVQPTEALRAE